MKLFKCNKELWLHYVLQESRLLVIQIQCKSAVVNVMKYNETSFHYGHCSQEGGTTEDAGDGRAVWVIYHKMEKTHVLYFYTSVALVQKPHWWDSNKSHDLTHVRATPNFTSKPFNLLHVSTLTVHFARFWSPHTTTAWVWHRIFGSHDSNRTVADGFTSIRTTVRQMNINCKSMWQCNSIG